MRAVSPGGPPASVAVESTCLGQGRVIYLCRCRLLCVGNDCHFHCGQALEIIRGCQGLNVVGCDLVEVSPPYDLSGECRDKHIYRQLLV